MAGNYDDILRYWEKLFSGDELGEELSKEKYKLESGSFQSEILDKIEADMYSTWQRSHSNVPYDEYKRGKMTGYNIVVDKFLGEGVTSMSMGNFDLNKYGNIKKNIQPAYDNESMLEQGYEWISTLGKWGLKKDGKLYESDIKDKIELNQEYQDWTNKINESRDVNDLSKLMNNLVDLKSHPEYNKVYDESGRYDKILSRQSDDKLIRLIEKANNKIRSIDDSKGYSQRDILLISRIKRDVEPLNYKEAIKTFGKETVDNRVDNFEDKYPYADLFEARREIIDRLQTEDRFEHNKPTTPLDLTWTKWLADYGGLRGDKESSELNLQNLKELKHYASYTGYYPIYKQAGLSKDEAKEVKQKINQKIDYLEGLNKQAREEIQKAKQRKPKLEAVVEEEEVEVVKPVSEYEQMEIAAKEWLQRGK